ncbi:MAG: GNAT family N-acetyltransferase [Halomonas sp.]|nr:GNAT family N-acetyltransferase [Halomonas sp.]
MGVRRADRSDIVSLLRLNHQLGLTHFNNAPEAFVQPSDAEKDFLLTALDETDRVFLVAEVAGDIVGFVTAKITRNESIPFLISSPICRVGTLVVDEASIGYGIGRKLMSHCHDWAISQGAEQIRLEVMSFNENAERFYKELGYKDQSKTLWKPVE